MGFIILCRNSWFKYDLHDECRYHDLDVTHSFDVCNNSFSSCFEADVQKKPRLINLSGQFRYISIQSRKTESDVWKMWEGFKLDPSNQAREFSQVSGFNVRFFF